jgi:hypothetical protein
VNAEMVFKVPRARADVMGALPAFLAAAGFVPVADAEPSLVFRRGGRLGSLLSLNIEDWPQELRIVLFEVDAHRSGVLLRYRVRSGLHLVGRLDKTVLEVEAALLRDFLVTGRVRSVTQAVAPVRRPVVVAVMLYMFLAVAVVTLIGVLGQYPVHWVALAATAVAFLDGVVIMAFADLILEGVSQLPRLNTETDDGIRASPDPSGSW